MKIKSGWMLSLVLLTATPAQAATELLVEAEAFTERGGWLLDP